MEEFVCPKCGSSYFGRDLDGIVTCHQHRCGWSGEWPQPAPAITHYHVGWLRTLIAEYRIIRDTLPDDDYDQTGTAEMMAANLDLLAALEAQYPEPVPPRCETVEGSPL